MKDTKRLMSEFRLRSFNVAGFGIIYLRWRVGKVSVGFVRVGGAKRAQQVIQGHHAMYEYFEEQSRRQRQKLANTPNEGGQHVT